MAHSSAINRPRQDYPGPNQAELGAVAVWIGPDEYLQLSGGAPWDQSEPTVPPAAEPIRVAAESYEGPTNAELADLVAWLEQRAPSRLRGGRAEAPAPRSTRLEQNQVWLEDCPEETKPTPAGPTETTLGAGDAADLDKLLSELDQIREALQKRPHP